MVRRYFMGDSADGIEALNPSKVTVLHVSCVSWGIVCFLSCWLHCLRFSFLSQNTATYFPLCESIEYDVFFKAMFYERGRKRKKKTQKETRQQIYTRKIVEKMPGLCMYSRLLHDCSVVLLETRVSFTICRSTFCLDFQLTTKDSLGKNFSALWQIRAVRTPL